jgi:hypothetical protein
MGIRWGISVVEMESEFSSGVICDYKEWNWNSQDLNLVLLFHFIKQ